MPLENLENLENISISYLIIKLWKIISTKRKVQIIFLLFLMLASSLSEIFSLVAVVPFLQILIEPESISKFEILLNITQFLRIESNDDFLLLVTTIFVSASIICAFIRLFNLWFNNMLAANIGSDLSIQSFKVTLYKPYRYHLDRNSSSLISVIIKEIANTVEVLRQILLLFTSTLIVLGLIIALFAINKTLATSSILIFSSLYLIIGNISKKTFVKNSKYILRNNIAIIKALQEGLGSIRDVLLNNSQNAYLKLYQGADRPMRMKEAQNVTMASFPRYSLEALSILIISLYAFSLTKSDVSRPELISLLGTLALAAQRMLPAMQQIYNAWASIKANLASVNNVINLINSSSLINDKVSKNEKLKFYKEINLENISFKYSGSAPLVLDSINLKIKKGQKIGIIGQTGCGKSTFLDILMGLLNPSSGKIFVDNICVNNDNDPDLIKFWRNSIAHVPQDIYLTDNTIAENIAFGENFNEIDFDKLKNSAKKAKIHNFIQSKSLGYRTIIGEKGITLSGGQIQRIAIARAFYKNANILIMDEGTSALDNETERQIIMEINNLNEDLTILMVAHRLSSLKGCDKIIKFEKGKVFDLSN